MNLFNRAKKSVAYSISVEANNFGFKVSLLSPEGKLVPLSLDVISSLRNDELDTQKFTALTFAIQNVGRFEFSSESSELSDDIHEAFSKSEIEIPLITLSDGSIYLSNLCIAAVRSGNLSEIANITPESISFLGIPEYTPLKAKIQAHNGVESSSFGLDLEIMDLNGATKYLKPGVGHTYIDEDEKTVFISPYLNRLIERHREHRDLRKTDTYKKDSQIRFRELAELRKAALNAEIRIDPFVKAQNIVFLKTLPYVLGRGPDEKIHLNPALPTEHSELDRNFQANLNSTEDAENPSHINLYEDGKVAARVIFSEEAWNDVQKIRSLRSQGQAALEEVIEDPLKFFGRRPRAAIAKTFSERVSGFIIGKLTSNRSDSSSGNDWGEGYEGNSTLLRAIDGSTIPLTYSPMPSEYMAIKLVCVKLGEQINNEELNLRAESGAVLTPVPVQNDRRIFIEELKGEFNLSELETCCSRIEYSNRLEIEPEQEAQAREAVELSEQRKLLVVEWGFQEDGSSKVIPLQSLKASLPQVSNHSPDDRVSLAIEDHSTSLGQAPDWHYLTCDLSKFAAPPYFRSGLSLEDHQRKGFAWLSWIFEHKIDSKMYPHRGALLADDMGLGKTVQLLSFVAWLRSRPMQGDKPILIVAPVSLIQSSWLEDGFQKFFEDTSVSGFVKGALGPILKFSDCPIRINRDLLLSEALRVNEELTSDDKRLSECEIDDGLKVELQAINEWAKGKVVITSYETLRMNSLALGSVDFAAVILDEAQKIKNVGVLQSNAAKALKADMCIAMTGTPIENSLMDLWSIMDFVLPGHLGTSEEFRERFVNRVKRAPPDSSERKRLREELERALSPVWFRRTKKEVFSDAKSLPPIYHYDQVQNSKGEITNTHQVQMSDPQYSIYETQLAYFKNAKPGHRLPVIRSMIEACAAPWIATDEPLRWSNRDRIFKLAPKLKVTIDILESIRSRSDIEGRKVIIFANVIQIQLGLAFFIYEWNKATGGDPTEIEVYNGEASPNLRGEMLARFKSRSGFQVIIISPKAGGAGLNIVEANNVIHYTREWNPALERQATDRVYRMGQTRPVHVFYPTTSLNGKSMVSAEERLANVLSAKRDIMDDFTVSASDHNISEGDMSDLGEPSSTKNQRLDSRGLHLLDPYSFECLIACIYDKLGYEAHWCGRSGDGGADVLALKKDSAILIQVKHKQGQGFVGTTAIREIRGAKSHYESKLKRPLLLMAATNHKFSERAVQLTREGDPVTLLEYSQIKSLLDEHPIFASDIERKKSSGKFKL
ncbi:SNF2-related protein [Bdellovibrio sp. HCB185ZH]|uniref:SNF2-related protein n=1 Tax=Bdellovibrio sp. HCB185ZH TaxID=3394235 RepID=UPI0039A76BC2